MRNFVFTIIAAIVLIISGCSEDFLERTNPNTISEDNFWITEEDAEAGLMGVYAWLQNDDLYARRFFFLEAISDNGFEEFGAGNLEISIGTHLPTNSVVTSFWRGNYTVVNRANDVLANVPSIDMDEDYKNQILGEAYFLRALAYLNLTTLYGNVPLLEEPLIVGDQPGNTPRDETRALMINDLIEAIDLLPASNPGRASLGAVQALLMKYYLYEEDYPEAATLGRTIINSGTYDLFDGAYGDLFTTANENDNEVIFSVKFAINLGSDQAESFSENFENIRPLPNFAEAFQCIDGLPITTSPLYNPDSVWVNRDPRFDATITREGEIRIEGEGLWDPLDSDTELAYQKYTTGVRGLSEGQQDFYVLRYADVLLMYAEAQNEDVGPDASVYDAVNEVRSRVGMPDLAVGLDQDQMRQAIRDERRFEFGFEGTRLFDLYRWGIAEDRFENGVTFHNRNYDSPKHDLWPIPQVELDNNENIDPNPGWE